MLFQIGTVFEFGPLRDRGRGRATLLVAAASVSAHLVLGFGFGLISARSLAPGVDRFVLRRRGRYYAVPILGRILREFGLTREPIGVVAIAAAAVNDVVGWVLLAFVSAYASMQFSWGFVASRLGLLAASGLVLGFVLRPAVSWLLRRMPVRDGWMTPDLLAVVLWLVFAMAIVTNAIGIFTIFGGFAAGLLFHRNLAFAEAWRTQVGQFVLVFFLPVFFTFTGLRTMCLVLQV